MNLPGIFTRRTVLKAGAALAASAAAPAATGGAVGIARGRVVVEAAGKTSPLPGIMVTNGRDVTLSGPDGEYQLPIGQNGIVSVVKPTGYAVPTQPLTNLPQFHYVHRPDGSPAHLNFAHPGVDPTGPLPASIDFVLKKRDEPTRFDALLFADPQPETDAEVDFIRDGIIPAVADAKAVFGITLGDIVGDDLSLFTRINSIIGTLGVPWYNVCGNHDLNYESPDDRWALETFVRTYGPSHYAFEYGGVLFIMLDNVVYQGSDPNEPGQMGSYHDRIDDLQLQFIANVLKHTPPDRLVVLGMHIPLKSRRDDQGREIAVEDTAALLDLLGDRPTVSFAGHTHMSEHRYIWREGASAPHHHQVLTTVCGSWWSGPFDRNGVAIADACDGSPNGYYVLSVDGAQCSTSFKPAHEARNRQVRTVLAEKLSDEYRALMIPKLRKPSMRRDDVGRTELVVNVFDGGPRTKVTCRFSNGAEVELLRESRPDPFVAAVYAGNRSTVKPWVQAERSSHVWAGELPTGLAPGAHVATVEATDEFGRTHRDTLAFETTSPTQRVAVRG